MNLLHMKYVVEVADIGSVNKAAEKLYVGQSNLSRAIKELESNLGVAIFDRSAKGMALTPEGEIFVRYARDILEQSLIYMGIAPDIGEPTPRTVSVPDVSGLDVEEAIRAIGEAGLEYTLDGSGARVVDQLPAAGADMNEGSLVMLYIDKKTDLSDNDKVRVPDVTGMSVLEANKLIRSFGLEMKIEGSGLAAFQTPEADEYVLPSTVVTVFYEPP